MNILIAIDNWLGNLPYRRNKRLKEELRAVLAQKRRILTTEQVELCSREVVTALLKLPTFQRAKKVMLYYPVQNEIDLRELFTLAPEKEYFLPIIHRKSIEIRRYAGEEKMRKGKFGIPEPLGEVYTGNVDVICVPGVAFDEANHRMGRGGGYYDRFLKYCKCAQKIGVGYKFQLKDKIPTNRQDVKMDAVVVSQSK